MAQELSKINAATTSMDLQRISQSDTVQALSDGRNDVVSKLLPTTIERAISEPKLFEMALATNEASVIRQIEYELILLASLMSVGGNLNKAQIPFIARQLVEMYPKESLADIKICFQRGAMGSYGEIQRMDGITIGLWMTEYLKEKYEVLEDAMMREKDEIYSRVQHSKPLLEADPIDVDKLLNEYKDQILGAPTRKIPPLSEQEIKEEGQIRPKVKRYQADPKAVYLSEKRIEYGRLWSDPNSYKGLLKPGAPDFELWLQENP